MADAPQEPQESTPFSFQSTAFRLSLVRTPPQSRAEQSRAHAYQSSPSAELNIAEVIPERSSFLCRAR